MRTDSDEEVMQRYQQVAPQLGQQEFLTAAQQAFNNMSPEQRMQFGQYVQQQLQAQGTPVQTFSPGQGNQQMHEDPGYLAQHAAQLHQQQPGLLEQLLKGGSGGGLLSKPAAKAGLAGIAAMAISNALGGRTSSPLGSIF